MQNKKIDNSLAPSSMPKIGALIISQFRLEPFETTDCYIDTDVSETFSPGGSTCETVSCFYFKKPTPKKNYYVFSENPTRLSKTSIENGSHLVNYELNKACALMISDELYKNEFIYIGQSSANGVKITKMWINKSLLKYLRLITIPVSVRKNSHFDSFDCRLILDTQAPSTFDNCVHVATADEVSLIGYTTMKYMNFIDTDAVYVSHDFAENHIMSLTCCNENAKRIIIESLNQKMISEDIGFKMLMNL
jgi:dihydrofolate reductase